MATRTVTDQEVVLKGELDTLVANGADAETILAKVNEITQVILTAAEAEAALKFQGHAWTPEQRQKMSEKMKGRAGKPWSEEQRAKQAAAWTPEKRAQLSASLKGRTLSPEARERLSNSLKAGKERKAAEQAALHQRIADLEAQVRSGVILQAESVAVDVTASEPDPENEGRQRGRRR